MSAVNILIVEDKRIIAMDIRNSLESLGYKVCASVCSGEEAVREAEEHRPDLILMDIMLEGEIDGIQAAQQIRSHLDIPVVYLTAYADEDTLHQAKMTEPYAYLVKPFEERELYTTIELALYKHKMESRLRESERWLATTLNSIGDAVIATDAAGFIKLVNPVAEQLTGWKEEHVQGRPLEEVFRIVHAEGCQPWEGPAQKAIETKKIVALVKDTVLTAKDGTERIIGGTIAPILDAGKNVRGVVLVFQDLTEKRKTEEEILKAHKLESIGAVAGSIAHDFNNILTTIMGYVSLAKLEAKQKDGISEKLERAKEACLVAKDLAQQLLTFSKGGTPLKETAFITKIIRDAVDSVLKGSSVLYHLNISHDIWPVEMDKGQIRQAIRNLIVNAGQTTPEGGIIQVHAENVTLDQTHDLPLKPGKYVRISIRNEGNVIPEEVLSKMFDPYFLIRQGEKGLGLAAVSSIIHGHEGYVTAQSHPDEGTTIFVYLPASEKEIVETKYLEGKFPVGKGRILLMDDEEMVRDAVGRVLQYLGYEVELAHNGNEAILLYQKARKRGEGFDAVIMDLTVSGGMGGQEAIKKLLEIDPNAKVIVSSGYSDDPIMVHFKDYGFRDVVAKPYQIEELSATLHKVIIED